MYAATFVFVSIDLSPANDRAGGFLPLLYDGYTVDMDDWLPVIIVTVLAGRALFALRSVYLVAYQGQERRRAARFNIRYVLYCVMPSVAALAWVMTWENKGPRRIALFLVLGGWAIATKLWEIRTRPLARDPQRAPEGVSPRV